MNLRSLLLALSGALALVTSAHAADKPVDVVASFSVLADIVKNVGGDRVAVTSLVPPEGDPHDYQPSPQDSKAVKNADVTFISGEGLESWFVRLAKAAGSSKKPVVVSEGVNTHTFVDDGKTITDPHVWNSVPNVILWVSNIEKALAKTSPENAAYFKENAGKYTQKLRDLDAYVHSKIDPVPSGKRKVLTSHDAFGYYGKEYGVTFLSPLGVSTETEASAAGIAKLINQIKKEHVSVYFLENSNDHRLVQQLASATGAQPGGELYPESLSKADGPVPTYLDLMKHNTDLIAAAISK